MSGTQSPKSKPLFHTRASGKLLLSGEYVVLDGALALALPVRYGQSLRVESWKEPGILSWSSKSEDGSNWFLAEFELPGLEILTETHRRTAESLVSFLKACQARNPDFLSGKEGLRAMTQNDFPRQWGLGTSSTLVAALAQWAKVDPYAVLFDTLGGSGYDVACAYASGPILYQLEGHIPKVKAVDFDPPFTQNIYFVYLERKQDSRNGIQLYKSSRNDKKALGQQISALTLRMVAADTLTAWDAALAEHETLISEALELPQAKSLHFPDYWGQIKSLGAWGGDFVMVTSLAPEAETRDYFKAKGFPTILNWDEMMG